MIVALVVLCALVWVLVARRLVRPDAPSTSIEHHHRTLSALHEAAGRSDEPVGPVPFGPVAVAAPPRVRASLGHRRTTLVTGTAVPVLLVAAAVVWSQWHPTGTDEGAGRPAPARSAAPSAPSGLTQPPPQPSVATVTAAGADGARVTVDRGTYTVALQASAPCWVRVRTAENGRLLFEGVLQAGQTRAFTSAGTLWARLGAAANVTVGVDGTPVPLPQAGRTPYNVLFAGASAGH